MIDKIGLIGYGKMGKLVEEMAAGKFTVAARFMDVEPFENNEETKRKLQGVPVLIDFSVSEAVIPHLTICCEWGISMVIGTTGWQDRIGEARALVEKSRIGVVYSSNFSLGVFLFNQIIHHAAHLMKRFETYSPYIVETHHQFKKDAPSGTALVLKGILEKEYSEGKVPVTSVRAGYIPGTHEVHFDSLVDTLSLTHTARSRQGFAAGALMAAEWIVGKRGLYTFQEMMEKIRSNHLQ